VWRLWFRSIRQFLQGTANRAQLSCPPREAASRGTASRWSPGARAPTAAERCPAKNKDFFRSCGFLRSAWSGPSPPGPVRSRRMLVLSGSSRSRTIARSWPFFSATREGLWGSFSGFPPILMVGLIVLSTAACRRAGTLVKLCTTVKDCLSRSTATGAPGGSVPSRRTMLRRVAIRSAVSVLSASIRTTVGDISRSSNASSFK
jgi:hypothetical protein